ncbi:MAG: hypothetical protein QOJ07_984 [Thermoleophilaceae bacterium]|nr:hypothetical protein [Thermoleophilaceae bacterium]
MEASALPRQRAALAPRSRRLLGALGDDRLVEQIRRGNDAAFEVVYDRHHRGVLSFCRHTLGSLEEAEDAVQQTFASAYTDLRRNRRDIRLKAWLYTIARNRCLSILRARREQPAELDEQVATAGLTEEVQQRADLRDLLGDLRELPPEQREALVLFELGDLSHAEIAGVLGVEPVKVKALVFQARSALIENREARSIPCTDIREQLATASGGALRRGPLRRHLKACTGCSEFRDQVRSQRKAMALLLPVVPSVGLKSAVLSALGIGGGAGGAGVAAGGAAGGAVGMATAGGSAAGGGAFASFAGMSGVKFAIAAVLATGAAGGGVLAEQTASGEAKPAGPATIATATTPTQSIAARRSRDPGHKRDGGAGRRGGAPAATPVGRKRGDQATTTSKTTARKHRHHRHHTPASTASNTTGGGSGNASSGGNASTGSGNGSNGNGSNGSGSNGNGGQGGRHATGVGNGHDGGPHGDGHGPGHATPAAPPVPVPTAPPAGEGDGHHGHGGGGQADGQRGGQGDGGDQQDRIGGVTGLAGGAGPS